MKYRNKEVLAEKPLSELSLVPLSQHNSNKASRGFAISLARLDIFISIQWD